MPESEYAALRLAEAAGVRIVDAWLVRADQVDGTVGLPRFIRAAGLLKVEPKILVTEVKSTVEKALDTWPGLLKELSMTDQANRAIVNRLYKLRLVQEVRRPNLSGIAML